MAEHIFSNRLYYLTTKIIKTPDQRAFNHADGAHHFQDSHSIVSATLFQQWHPVYITKRFDVVESGEHAGKRLNQNDFAQIAGLVPEVSGSDYKYKGISYEGIASLIRKNVSAADVAVEVFFRTVLFNYLVCNGDAHAKNFSLRNSIEEPDVYDLTPAYDLLNTSLHIPNESSRTALDLFKDEDDFKTPFTRQTVLRFA